MFAALEVGVGVGAGVRTRRDDADVTRAALCTGTFLRMGLLAYLLCSAARLHGPACVAVRPRCVRQLLASRRPCRRAGSPLGEEGIGVRDHTA